MARSVFPGFPKEAATFFRGLARKTTSTLDPMDRTRPELWVVQLGEIDYLGTGALDALGAGVFESVQAIEHQRRDRQEREKDQPGANAQYRLAAPRRLARLCWSVRHHHPPPRFHTVVETRKNRLRTFDKI